MSVYPRIEGPNEYGVYTLHIRPDQSVRVSDYEIGELAFILDAMKSNDARIGSYNFNGLVTVDRDGIEIIQGWYGGYSYVRHVAEKQVKNGNTKGARAYVCIGEFGDFELPDVIQSDEEDDCCEVAKDPTVSLDRWVES